MADNDQKTLEPTPQKLEEARRKGDVPSAPEMRHAAMFLAMLVIVALLGVHATGSLAALSAEIWGGAGDRPIDPRGAPAIGRHLLGGMVAAIGPLLLVTLAAAAAGWLAQGNPSLAAERLKPKWDRLSLPAGFKRLLGRRAWVEFAKTIAKFAFVGAIVSMVAWPAMSGLDRLVGADAGSIGAYAGGAATDMARTAAMLVGALAAADWFYQRRSWIARQRMTPQEMKDEHKRNEGDPQIKARVRAIQMQRARNRMMAAVPDASVVITNPTHFAVALRYDHGRMNAPVVVAKGADLIAAKIREIARTHRVPIVESPALARTLYSGVEIEQPIRIEHYAAVAEIISYVMRLTRQAPAIRP